MAQTGHNCLHLAAIMAACLTFGGAILFTSGALGHRLGFFINNTDNLADKYYLKKYKMDVTPSDWTFYISALIYLWQAVWLAYGVTLTCRKSASGYLYRAYPVLPPILYVVFSFSLACNISWLLIWDREYMEVALVFINLMACTLFICLVVSLRRLNDYGHLMIRDNVQNDIWLIRIFVQNGLAMYATWGTVASIFNFALVLTFRTGAEQQVGSMVSLTVFTLEIFAWWIFDNFVFEKLFRYLLTPYVVVLVAIIGIISKNWDPSDGNSIYTVTLLALAVFLTAVKCALAVYKHWKQPIFGAKSSGHRRPLVSFEVRSLLEAQPHS